MTTKLERIKRLEAERDKLMEALGAMITAVTYVGECDLPNNAGRGYVAYVPDTFVKDARQALASITDKE